MKYESGDTPAAMTPQLNRNSTLDYSVKASRDLCRATVATEGQVSSRSLQFVPIPD